MKISFSKYQGTGNDFVMLDNLNGQYDSLTIPQIKLLCDRRFGVGSDGLMKINSHKSSDFEVEYFNSDGSKSFCGNGARCSVSFAETLGLNVSNTIFLGIDGLHHASKNNDVISLEMGNVSNFNRVNDDYVIHTGSPHYVHFIESIDELYVVQFGKEIRYSEEFKKDGINVNLVEVINSNALIVNTYERGVEDETLSCGTGVTASVLAHGLNNNLIGSHKVSVKVKGGQLEVSFIQESLGIFKNIKLIGPGEFVFSGEINV